VRVGGASADKQPWWRAPWPNWWLRLGAIGLMVFGGQLALALIFGNEPGDESLLVKTIATVAFACVTGVGLIIWLRTRTSTNA
jgi:hypothetical protein